MSGFYTVETNVVETEKFVLSAMLILISGAKIIPRVTEVLKANNFHRPAHRIVFEAIDKVFDRGDTPNLLTPIDDLQGTGTIKDIDIEYTVDIVWALKLNATRKLRDGINISKVRMFIDEIEKAAPLEIRFKCLKNRLEPLYDSS